MRFLYPHSPWRKNTHPRHQCGHCGKTCYVRALWQHDLSSTVGQFRRAVQTQANYFCPSKGDDHEHKFWSDRLCPLKKRILTLPGHRHQRLATVEWESKMRCRRRAQGLRYLCNRRKKCCTPENNRSYLWIPAGVHEQNICTSGLKIYGSNLSLHRISCRLNNHSSMQSKQQTN